MLLRSAARIGLFGLSLVAGAGLLAFLVYQQGPENILESLLSFGFWPFVGFVAISLVNFIFYSWRWQLIINRHVSPKARVPLSRMYLHRLGGYAVSYLTPAAQVGGEPVRMTLLSTEKDVSMKQSTSSVVLDIAFELSAYALFILAGVVLAVLQGLGDANSLLFIFIGLGSMLGLLIAFFATMAYGKGFFAPLFKAMKLDRVKRLKKIEHAIVETETMMGEFLSKNKKLVVVVAFLSVLVISFRVVEVFYIAHFFNVQLNFAQAFLVSTLPGVALILPVPAGLGVFEGGFAAIFGVLMIPLNAVAFALIIRSRDIVFIVGGVIHILMKGSAFLQNKVVKPLIKPS